MSLAHNDSVDHLKKRHGAGGNHIGVHSSPTDLASVEFNFHQRLALSVEAAGYASDSVIGDFQIDSRPSLDRLQNGVDRAIADRRLANNLAIDVFQCY